MLGHYLRLYDADRRRILKLEDHLEQFGYQKPVQHVQEPCIDAIIGASLLPGYEAGAKVQAPLHALLRPSQSAVRASRLLHRCPACAQLHRPTT